MTPLEDSRSSGLFVGLTVLDVISRVRTPPSANEKITALSQEIRAGGPAANAAVTFAALGGKAHLITALGQSAAATIARQDLEEFGVNVIDLAPQHFTCAVSSVTVTHATGERSVVSTDGGAVPVLWQPCEEFERLVPEIDVVLVDGHFPALAHGVLDVMQATDRAVPVVVDAGRWKPQFEHLIPRATDVVASADFFDNLGYVPLGPSFSSVLPNVRVARTRGERSILWWLSHDHGEVDVPSVKSVDTLGAGDVFHGAYAYEIASALSSGVSNPQEQALTQAARIAACKVQHVGTRSWIELWRTEAE